MIIDTHTHVFKKMIYMDKIIREFSPELLIALMDNAGVDRAILISFDLEHISSDPMIKDHLNDIIIKKEYTLEAFKKYPDRFIWFTYGFYMQNENYLEILKNDIENGASGIKLFPSLTGFSIEDSRLKNVFDFCQKNNIPVILSHENWNDISRPPYVNNYKEYIKKVKALLEKYKDIKWLFCHLGAFNWLPEAGDTLADARDVYKNIDEFIELMSYPNVWTDIAALTLCYNETYPYPTVIKLLKRLTSEISIDKFMFATDWPWTEEFCTYKQTVDMINNLNFLNSEEKKKFLGENVANFLNLKNEKSKSN